MIDYYRVLYYPHFQPNARWLLSMLLLTDRIDRIVPDEADPNDSDLIKELIQEIPGCFVSKSPVTTDIDFDRLTLQRLKHAFRLIRKQLFGNTKRQVKFLIGDDGTLEIDGHVFLHHGKVASKVRELLIEEGMLRTSLDDITSSVGIDN